MLERQSHFSECMQIPKNTFVHELSIYIQVDPRLRIWVVRANHQKPMGQNGSSIDYTVNVFARIWVLIENFRTGPSGQWKCHSISTGQDNSIEGEMLEVVKWLWSYSIRKKLCDRREYPPDPGRTMTMPLHMYGPRRFHWAPIGPAVVESHHPQEFW